MRYDFGEGLELLAQAEPRRVNHRPILLCPPHQRLPADVMRAPRLRRRQADYGMFVPQAERRVVLLGAPAEM